MDYDYLSLEELSCKVATLLRNCWNALLFREKIICAKGENRGEALHNFARLWESVRSC